MQCCVREYRVELAVKGQILAGHYPRVDAAGPGRSDHLGCGVDGYNRNARRGDLFGQDPVATAQVEDALPGRGCQQLEHRRPKSRHEMSRLGIAPGGPLLAGDPRAAHACACSA